MATQIHVINKDAKTEYIAAWQQFLANQKYNIGSVDGIWGPHTSTITEQFQGDNKPLTKDGKVGPATLQLAEEKYQFQIPNISNFEVLGQSNTVIDVSHYQQFNPRTDVDSICFENAYHDGIRAVIHKCTERNTSGKNSTDPTYIRRVAKGKSAGMLWGAYHFGGPGSGVGQANYFLSVVKQHGDTVLSLDWESTSMPIEEAINFINTIVSKTGKYPLLYSRTGFLNDSHPTSEQLAILSKCPLWLSAYIWKTNTPKLPTGWKQYQFWQFSDNIHGHGAVPVPGVGACDRNLFNGSETELNTFWESNQY